jgi:DNA adenine methylase
LRLVGPPAALALGRRSRYTRTFRILNPEGLTVTKLTPPLKWHGGKGAFNGKLARWIVGLMPPHLHYVEPYAGGLSVLLAKDPEGVSEVVNDLDGRLMTFWRVLGEPALFEQFRRRVEAIPLSRAAWQEAQAHTYGTDRLADAVAFFVCCRQSLAGRMKGWTSLTRTRTRRGRNGNVSEWVGAVTGLADVHARLWGRVAFESMPALQLIRREDGPGTLFYLDPPYLPRTRTARKVYALEMIEADHAELLALVGRLQGKVMLSGYPSELYDRALAGWTRHTFDLPNNAAGGAKKDRETEVLWCNF